jgi:hypothetical protein
MRTENDLVAGSLAGLLLKPLKSYSYIRTPCTELPPQRKNRSKEIVNIVGIGLGRAAGRSVLSALSAKSLP